MFVYNLRCLCSSAGVYFSSRVETVKFVDFCGKYRVPLLQYLCSPHCRKPRARASRQPVARQRRRRTACLVSSDSDVDDLDQFGDTYAYGNTPPSSSDPFASQVCGYELSF